MAHKFDPRNMRKLEERKKILPPKQILIELGLKPNDVMIDIGAGAGDFSIPASEVVGINGRVIAIDTSEAMLLEFKKRIRKSDPGNIVIVQSQEYNLIVDDNTADFALICTVLHEIENKILFLEKVRNVIKPGGRLAIIEWARKPMDQGPPLEDRIDKSEAEAFLKQAEFHEIQAKDYNDFFYYATAVK
jgi:ubiquinone/menaquinone biosynthesis C-methylase UbiE